MSIFLVKRPHQGQSTVMHASDKKQFCEMVKAGNKSGDVIFDVLSIAELRKSFGYETAAEFFVNVTDDHLWLHGLMIAHGEKTLVQKTFMDTTYEVTAGIDLEQKRFDACLEFETHEWFSYDLFESNKAAIDAYNEEKIWNGLLSAAARHALGKALDELGLIVLSHSE